MPSKLSKVILRARQLLIQSCEEAQRCDGTMTVYEHSYPRILLKQVAQAEGMTEVQYKRKLEQTYGIRIENDSRNSANYLIFGNWKTALLMVDLVQRLERNYLLPPDE